MRAEPWLPPAARRPRHVAVIMDGNGRWAQDHGLPRLEGHRRGAQVVREITTFARELDISFLTLYSFSRQNWRRSADEVGGLMTLLEDYCARERETLMRNQIRLITIGQTARLPVSTRRALSDLSAETGGNGRMTLCLAIDYGAREEMVAAARRVAEAVARGALDPEGIDEAAVAGRLDTSGMPDPDLLIRTSGERRVSNFLLWQLAYAELYFTPVRWPDFGRREFAAALCDFAARERRFGGTGEAPAPPRPATASVDAIAGAPGVLLASRGPP